MKNIKFGALVGLFLACTFFGCDDSNDPITGNPAVLGKHEINQEVAIARQDGKEVRFLVEEDELITYLEWSVNEELGDAETVYSFTEMHVEPGDNAYLVARFRNNIGKHHLVGIQLKQNEKGVYTIPAGTKKHACTPKATCDGCDFKRDSDNKITGCICQNSRDELKCQHSVSITEDGVKTTCTSFDCTFCDIVKEDGKWTCPCGSDKDKTCKKSVAEVDATTGN